MLSNFYNYYLDNKFTYLAHTWVFTQGSSTTDVVKSLLNWTRIYLHLCNSSIAHDSVTTPFLKSIEFNSRYLFPLIWH